MNLKSNIIKRLFSEEDILELEKAIVRDKVILRSLEKILIRRLVPIKESDLDKPNYEFRRAFIDGKNYELTWMLEFLSKKENEDAEEKKN